MRTRANFFVFIARIIDSIPLCPPLPRLKEIFIAPSGRSKSSYTTANRSADFAVFTNLETANPDLFINVFGRTSATSVFPWLAEALCGGGTTKPRDTSDFDFLSSFHSLNFAVFAKCSTAIRPLLCRVPSYSYPGFPKPTKIQAMLQHT